jgi:hypothetical protein
MHSRPVNPDLSHPGKDGSFKSAGANVKESRAKTFSSRAGKSGGSNGGSRSKIPSGGAKKGRGGKAY